MAELSPLSNIMIPYMSGMLEFSWGLFIALAVSAICIALGVPFGPVLFFGVVSGLIIAFRYTYFSYYAAIALTPFLGFMISIPTGEIAFGRRAFGGAIDISVAEVVFLAVLAAWSLKIIFFWVRRHDGNWRPRFPLAISYASLFAAHLLSAFSPLQPAAVLVFKFALRPVLFSYLAYVALPFNLLRSRRRLVVALSILSGVGVIGAVNGAISLFFVGPNSQFIRRAHPLPMFGIPALGDNHNLLAELMAATTLITLALSVLESRENIRRLLVGAAIFQGIIGLLTFSRTVWIVFIAQAAFLFLARYRETLRRHLAGIIAALIVVIPLAITMTRISASNVATSSNSTRIALLEIALDVFRTSPWLGGGAGTFVERVGGAHVFRLEYGEPLDAHGFIQKLAAETGVVGILAFIFVALHFSWVIRRGWEGIAHDQDRRAMLFLIAGAGGAILYQLFNTNYWTGKMWLPLGLALAALNVFSVRSREENWRLI